MQLDPTVQALLNRQINAELYASVLYYAVNAWADAQGFEGLAVWALGEAQDEESHARRFLEYTNQRGQAALGAVAAPPSGFSDYAAALAALLQAEQATSAALIELDKAAYAATDPATCLIATQQILNEQVPAEHRLTQALLIVRRGAPIDLLDAELWEDAG